MKNLNKIKKTLIIVMALAVMATSGVVCVAADATATGTGEVNATVPISGSISALTLSVTHPADVAYTIDPNTGATGTFTVPDITITNNTKCAISVTVSDLSSVTGGTVQFTDVGPADKIWASLNLADSKTYLALGIKAKDATGWNTGYSTTTMYANTVDPQLFGSINSNASATMQLVANYGLVFDQPYTAKHSLVFLFNMA